MWVMVSSRWSKFPCAVYRYYPDRKYEHAREMIGADYSGIIQSDGYEAYQKLQDAKNAMCMAHARRDCVEALKGSPLHSNQALQQRGSEALIGRKSRLSNHDGSDAKSGQAVSL